MSLQCLKHLYLQASSYPMLSQSFLIDADRDQHLLKELMAGIDPLCDLFSAFRKSDVSVQIHLHITFCAEFLHCDTDTGLGVIHLIDNVDGSYISVSLTQDQYVFQIILGSFLNFQSLHFFLLGVTGAIRTSVLSDSFPPTLC